MENLFEETLAQALLGKKVLFEIRRDRGCGPILCRLSQARDDGVEELCEFPMDDLFAFQKKGFDRLFELALRSSAVPRLQEIGCE